MKAHILICLIRLLLVIFIIELCGCSMFAHQAEEKPVAELPTIAPTPDVQLYQAAKKSNWLVTMSILGIACGVFALVSGAAKLGSAAIASSSVSLFMTLAVSRFAFWMAVFGLIGSAVAALYSILVRRKALVEIIKGVQIYKDSNVSSPSLTSALDNQVKTTKKIVGNIKNELKLKGVI